METLNRSLSTRFGMYMHSIRYTFIKFPRIFLSRKANRRITQNFTVLFFIFTLSWYIYISNSSTFYSVVYLFLNIKNSIFSDFMNPKFVEGLSVMAIKTYSFTHHLNKIINYSNQIFLIVGFFYVIFHKLLKSTFVKFHTEFLSFSVVSLVFLFAGISVPHFASALNISRIYQISLIFLAPFEIIGFAFVLGLINSVINFKNMKHIYIQFSTGGIKKYSLNNLNKDGHFLSPDMTKCLNLASIYFVLFFLFQVGFVYEVTEGFSTSIALSSNLEYDYPRFNEQEIVCANWLFDVKSPDPLYADSFRFLLLGGFDWDNTIPIDFRDRSPDKFPSKKSYLYFGTYNILKQKELIDFASNQDKVYSNGGAQVHFE